jgi:D-aminoacyl-tRNA deacylase
LNRRAGEGKGSGTMRAVVQRVNHASVTVEGAVVGRIERGICVLVGVGRGDEEADAQALAEKVVSLRIFEDDAQKMNLSLLETGGALLAVSQFTLFGDVRKGKRPSFSEALEPVRAQALFEHFCAACRVLGARVETGRFRAHMQVTLENDGPVTILIDSKRAF